MPDRSRANSVDQAPQVAPPAQQEEIIQAPDVLLQVVQDEVGQVVPEQAQADLQTIRDIRDGANTAPELVAVLDEVLGMHDRVLRYQTEGGAANANRVFGDDGALQGYDVVYHGQVQDIAMRIANLVHELTHVSANENLDNNFVLYTNNAAGADGVDQVFANDNGRRRLGNEGAFQNGVRDQGADNVLGQQLVTLNGHIAEAGFTDQQAGQIRGRIAYGIQQPHLEYDTVINQMMVWMHFWVNADGSTLAEDSDFYVELRAQADAAHARRTGDGQSATSNVPADIDSLFAAPAPAPAPRTDRCCWLTTACTAARGLPEDCTELTVLRRFRDEWLFAQPDGPELIDDYYATAPGLVDAIGAHEAADEVLDRIFRDVTACVAHITAGNPEAARDRYVAMVHRLHDRFE